MVSSFALMSVPPEEGVPEVSRVLRPRGWLVMTAWARTGFLATMHEAMAQVLPWMHDVPHLRWADDGAAQRLLSPHFTEVQVARHSLAWEFDSVAEGMALYREGSPAHTASYLVAGERAGDLDQVLEQHLREHAAGDGTVRSSTDYLVITARKAV